MIIKLSLREYILFVIICPISTFFFEFPKLFCYLYVQERHFNFFLGGGANFVFNATGLLKNWKKEHFICGNLAYVIHSSLLFFSFFLFFPWGDGPLAPSNDAPAFVSYYVGLQHHVNLNQRCKNNFFQNEAFLVYSLS